MSYTIINSNNIDYLKTQPDNCFDSIVTDPPYGIEFLAKDWDSNTGALETWQECLRTLKPGGYILAFSAARTYHQLATNIEAAGFEIRDQIMWIYASGFPKAQDIGKAIQRRQGVEKTTINEWASKNTMNNVLSEAQGKERLVDKPADKGIETPVPTSPEAQQWAGWKTALKPAHEPIVMARKPFKGSTIDNVLKHGTGALNIDATRIPSTPERIAEIRKINAGGGLPAADGIEKYGSIGESNQNKQQQYQLAEGRYPANVLGEIPDYQKYFYCPKVSRKERHCGFEQTETTQQMVESVGGTYLGTHECWLPGVGNIKGHGIRHEVEKIRKNKDQLQHLGRQNYNTGYHSEDPLRKDPLAHIQERKQKLGDSAPQGQRRCSKDSYERWQQSIEYRKGGKPDPLAHIEKPFQVETQFDIHKRQDGVKNAMIKQAENTTKNVGNNHPTVKPVALMRYLIQLVTPKGGRVLDPFSGSGSTGMAAVELGHEFVGCELDPNYVEIARKRIEGWIAKTPQQQQFEKVFDVDSN